MLQNFSDEPYTSYDKGINGIMVDIVNLPGVPTAADFLFRAGNDSDPYGDGWEDFLETPQVTVRPGDGDFDRVTLIWEENAARNQWLQVTVLPNGRTGLATADVFYFGNAIGESGTSPFDAKVNAVDVLLARNNPRNATHPASITSKVDYNRDQRANATDMLLARDNQTHLLDALKLIGVSGAKSEARMTSNKNDALSVGIWLYEFGQSETQRRPEFHQRSSCGRKCDGGQSVRSRDLVFSIRR